MLDTTICKQTKLWKESLNSYGHQFHQYQQNEQSALILTELTEHNKKDQDIWCYSVKTTFNLVKCFIRKFIRVKQCFNYNISLYVNNCLKF